MMRRAVTKAKITSRILEEDVGLLNTLLLITQIPEIAHKFANSNFSLYMS